MSAIRLEQISFKLGHQMVLENVSVNLTKGAFAVLVGSYEIGKHALMDLLTGEKSPSRGRVSILGAEPKAQQQTLKRRVAHLTSKADLPSKWVACEYLAFNRFYYPGYDRDLEARLMRMFDIDPRAQISRMTSEEKRRLHVVAQLAAKPEVILVDELTTLLDHNGRRALVAYLGEQSREHGVCVFVTTSLLEDLTNFATQVMMLKPGTTQEPAPPADFLKKAKVPPRKSFAGAPSGNVFSQVFEAAQRLLA